MPWKRMCIFAVIALLFAAADLLTKEWADRSLKGREPIQVIPGCLKFQYSTNTGAAFGWGAAEGGDKDGKRSPTAVKYIRFFISVSIVAALVIPFIVWRIRERPLLTPICFGLVEGGVLGNLKDRIANDGNVRDFILAYIDKHEWPIFNVADSCITVGVILLVYISLFPGRKGKAKEAGKGAPPAAPGG